VTTRRRLLAASAAAALTPKLVGLAASEEIRSDVRVKPANSTILFTAPVELAGDWGRMLENSADLVVERMRLTCLDGVRLLSDRQPTRLRVDQHTSGTPAIWLHPDGTSMASTRADVEFVVICRIVPYCLPVSVLDDFSVFQSMPLESGLSTSPASMSAFDDAKHAR
jgi:hypothetical protein